LDGISAHTDGGYIALYYEKENFAMEKYQKLLRN
jgi:hypothetical protein